MPLCVLAAARTELISGFTVQLSLCLVTALAQVKGMFVLTGSASSSDGAG